ncbi:ankyrin repeat-containing protein [Apiospora marii]|uniref:Ankyrin repeat-containing protein n=1 Tax=Apiospora marii TaxID=335849 RepID=A0ABR1RVA6_9PEZI
MPGIFFDGDQGIDPQNSSALVQLPPEIHLGIAMESDSDETVFAMLRTCKKLFGVYRDLLYERNIRHDNGSAVFKIARNGEVAAFEHLERTAKTMDEGLPGLSRVQFVSSEGRTFTGNSFADRPSFPFTPEFSFTPLHWAAAAGHSGTVQWLLTKRAECNALGKSSANRFNPISTTRYFDWHHLCEQTREPCTPLHVAVCTGDVGIIISLLGAGSVLNVDDPAGKLPEILKIALIYGHVDLIRYVVQNNYAIPDHDHLRYAAGSPMCITSLRCLAELGCNIIHGLKVLIRNGEHDTEAMEMLQDPTIRLDLSRPVDTDPPTNQATSFLYDCMARWEVDTANLESFRRLVVFLIKSGADVNYRASNPGGNDDSFVRRSLLYNDNGCILQELLENGAHLRTLPDEWDIVNWYLQQMSDQPVRGHCNMNDDGSCGAAHKLRILFEHGAVTYTCPGFPPLEFVYMCYTKKLIDPVGLLPVMKLLVDNGVSRDPVAVPLFTNHRRPHSFLFRALTAGHYDIAHILIERGGTCFDTQDPMEGIDECYNQVPEDIRQWIDAAYFL